MSIPPTTSFGDQYSILSPLGLLKKVMTLISQLVTVSPPRYPDLIHRWNDYNAPQSGKRNHELLAALGRLFTRRLVAFIRQYLAEPQADSG